MKISKIIPYVLNEDLEKEFFFSQWEYSNRKICIVKIICDDGIVGWGEAYGCLLYTSPSPRDRQKSRMPSSA